ncbi:hypothetical protein STEG23_036389, partial [Scotinomys teguina]
REATTGLTVTAISCHTIYPSSRYVTFADLKFAMYLWLTLNSWRSACLFLFFTAE